jgi:UDP-3-O-[3-hydroxymyristoyl] N-acetylglucosamine deacetylase
MATFQKTINNEVNCSGIGLHSGKEVNIKLLPGKADSGIIFKRIDVVDKNNIIAAKYDNVTQTNLGTVISNEDGVQVSTIEHLMSALWCLEIDNVIIEINNVETPIVDGSCEPFIFLIECAGSKVLDKPRKTIEILKEITFKSEEKFVTAKPSKDFSVDLEIDFNSKQIKETKYHYNESKSSFKNDISRARTFCFKSEIDQMHQMGLAKGGSLDNAIVIDEDRILNEGPLRYKDEFVKHKLLDFIGDIYLAGYRISGEFSAFKSGHSINNAFLRELFSKKDSWRLI